MSDGFGASVLLLCNSAIQLSQVDSKRMFNSGIVSIVRNIYIAPGRSIMLSVNVVLCC